MHGAPGLDARLGRQLVLDELFDLTLYQSLLRVAPPALRPILEQLIPIETRHYGFWQEFFGLKITTLDLPRRAKLALLVGLARLLGAQLKRIISDPLWLPDFYNPQKVGGPLLDLHVHDAHFIRLTCGMPAAVYSRGRMRGEVVEFVQTQFLFDNPGLVVGAISGKRLAVEMNRGGNHLAAQ